MCQVLGVSRSGYYEYRSRPKSERGLANDKLLIKIKRVYLWNQELYGSPRIWDQLRNKENIVSSENRVARVMRENKILAVQRKKFRLTTNSRHEFPVWPNILKRQFEVDRPNAVRVSDITYIWTQEGWMYLAVILDLFSRRLIVHSDRGSQYAGNDFKKVLKDHGHLGSMSRKGDCWDIAVAESFFHTLKVSWYTGLSSGPGKKPVKQYSCMCICITIQGEVIRLSGI